VSFFLSCPDGRLKPMVADGGPFKMDPMPLTDSQQNFEESINHIAKHVL
jgi:hypothetical protein